MRTYPIKLTYHVRSYSFGACYDPDPEKDVVTLPSSAGYLAEEIRTLGEVDI